MKTVYHIIEKNINDEDIVVMSSLDKDLLIESFVESIRNELIGLVRNLPVGEIWKMISDSGEYTLTESKFVE